MCKTVARDLLNRFLFFWCGGVVFLQGVLRNFGGRRWFFVGQFVVNPWQKMVC